MARLMASNVTISEAIAEANSYLSQMHNVNVSAIADNITAILSARDNNTLQRNRLNDTCAYYHIVKFILI